MGEVGESRLTTSQQTTQEATPRIICPSCDSSVRPVDETPCPNCRCCPSCGRKLARGESRCGCGSADNPDRIATLVRLFGVTDEQAEIEVKRIEIRKRLERTHLVLFGIIMAAWAIGGQIVRDILEPRSLMQRSVFALLLTAVIALFVVALQRWLRRKENRILQLEMNQDRQTMQDTDQ